MERTYKITAFNEQIGQVIAMVGDQSFAIDLPIFDGLYPTGDELDAYILGFFPPADTSRLDALSSGVANSAEIAAKVEPLTTNTIDEQNNTLMLQQMYFERQVAQTLVKFGLLESDPTAVEVTQL
jgi:hypothetical protein